MTAESTPDTAIAGRQSVMRTLTLAGAEALEAAYAGFEPKPDWQFARRPETGLVMARGRMGGGGAPFNLGEVPVTRSAVVLESGETGYAYCQGRNQRKSAIAAFFDAAWQNADLRPRVEREVLAPLNEQIAGQDKRVVRETAATRVDFFTMVRGDN